MSEHFPENRQPTVELVNVTPDMAATWLEQTNRRNRKIKESIVVRYSRDMRDDKWILTHQGIAFSPDDILLDGQHRLWAVVESGRTIAMHVWRNITDEAMMVIDSATGRSMTDILNIARRNGQVTNHQVACLRAMLGGLSAKVPRLTPAEVSELLQQYGKAVAFAIENLPAIASTRGINTATTRGVMARAYFSVHHVTLREFCRKLTTGIVTSDGEGVVVLLRQTLQMTGASGLANRIARYAKIERALRAYVDGENPSRIHCVTSEQFPLPGEDEL